MIKKLVVTAGILVVLVGLLILVSSHFLTDWMWFSSLGFSQLFTNALAWEWTTRILAFVGLTLFLFINLIFTRAVIDQMLLRYPQLTQYIKKNHITLVLAGLSVLLGAIYSSGYSRFYWDIAQFFNRVSFGQVDPIFGLDFSFYMFELPFYRLISGALLGALFLAIIAVGGLYFGSGSISFTDFKLNISNKAARHLSLLLGLFVLIRSGSYLLDMYELVYSQRGAVFGPAYTDVNVRIWVYLVLMALSLLVAIILLTQLYKYRKLIIGAVGLYLITSIVLGSVTPALVQQWIVEPNEFSREEEYIEHHINMTRKAYNLNNFVIEDFPGDGELTWDDIDENRDTIDNIRLWDPRPLLQTYSQLQEMRLYYRFLDADVGRYWVDGEYRQVFLSARELITEQIQNRTWINEHLQYTHGFGAVVSPVNEVSRQGLPEFWISDIPPKSEVNLEITEPRIYYGEKTDNYVIVNTLTEEFDYPMGERNAFTTYEGTGGVVMSSLYHRLAFAIRFGTPRILLSSDITNESRALFDRNIKDRVQKLAPFLRYDEDPYLVISDEGRLVWILDGYTTSNRFPYAQPVRGWGNYVRNSVKVVIDAYNGSVDFYQVEDDPVLETAANIFPGWLKSIDEMPVDLRSHIRYPEELLTLQARVYGTYHMTNRRVFYNREDVWQFANEVFAGREQEMLPYYNIMNLPGKSQPEMVLMLPLTPIRRNNMIAWLAARNDGENYGEVIVYRFPKDSLTYGPSQIEARIDQDSDISQLLSLWGQRGSQVIRGNLLVIPVNDGLIYVEPLFLQSDQSSLPQLQRVIAAHQDELVMEPSLELALQSLFGKREYVPEEEILEEAPLALDDMAFLPEDALEIYQQAQEALRDGDFVTFGEAWQELEEILTQLIGE